MADEQTEKQAPAKPKKPLAKGFDKPAEGRNAEFADKHVLIRTNCLGIWFGIWDGYRTAPVDGKKHPRHIITLREARRVWELGNQSFDDLAEFGPRKGSTVKVMAEVDEQELDDKTFGSEKAYRVAELTDKAVAAFAKIEAYEHP